MKRTLGGALAGAIVFFIWGFLAWPTLHLYNFAFPATPRDGAIRSVLSDSLSHDGAFVIPSPPARTDVGSEADHEAMMQAWTERHREGPIAVILFRRAGAEPLDPMVTLRGFGIELLAAVLLALLLSCTRIPTIGGRLCFIFFAALFAVITTHAVQWNFFFLPAEYTFVMIIDPLIGWLLAGIPMAIIIRPPVVSAA